MVETEITIIVNRKADIDQVKEEIIGQKIQFPIFIFEYENHFQLKLSSDYEQWEFDTAILNCFPDYEFTSNIEKGRKEIRMQISRYQSELATDNWGRPIENLLRETKYLIKKSNNKSERINPNIKVLFESDEQDYYINLVNGINKNTEEKGFLLQNEFKAKYDVGKAEILKDRLYKTPQEALQCGYYRMQELVNDDFKEYIENKKKKIRKQQRLPRKIIRDFINFCNEGNQEGILKKIDKNIIFEKRANCERKLLLEGIKEFEEYINSPNQELCNRDFKISSTWDFKPSSITIGIKYLQFSNNQGKEEYNVLNFGKITFELKDEKIISIVTYD
jgi:hypothetical protein